MVRRGKLMGWQLVWMCGKSVFRGGGGGWWFPFEVFRPFVDSPVSSNETLGHPEDRTVRE